MLPKIRQLKASCNYSGTSLWPPPAALKKKGDFVGTPHAPVGGRLSPCTPSDRSSLTNYSY